jgi:L-alanine-DL-glutamate epimerase-like enolase superfamily enzyme
VSGLLREPFELVDGAYAVPTAPGLGIELDERALERFRV